MVRVMGRSTEVPAWNKGERVTQDDFAPEPVAAMAHGSPPAASLLLREPFALLEMKKWFLMRKLIFRNSDAAKSTPQPPTLKRACQSWGSGARGFRVNEGTEGVRVHSVGRGEAGWHVRTRVATLTWDSFHRRH